MYVPSEMKVKMSMAAIPVDSVGATPLDHK